MNQADVWVRHEVKHEVGYIFITKLFFFLFFDTNFSMLHSFQFHIVTNTLRYEIIKDLHRNMFHHSNPHHEFQTANMSSDMICYKNITERLLLKKIEYSNTGKNNKHPICQRRNIKSTQTMTQTVSHTQEWCRPPGPLGSASLLQIAWRHLLKVEAAEGNPHVLRLLPGAASVLSSASETRNTKTLMVTVSIKSNKETWVCHLQQPLCAPSHVYHLTTPPGS